MHYLIHNEILHPTCSRRNYIQQDLETVNYNTILKVIYRKVKHFKKFNIYSSSPTFIITNLFNIVLFTLIVLFDCYQIIFISLWTTRFLQKTYKATSASHFFVEQRKKTMQRFEIVMLIYRFFFKKKKFFVNTTDTQ